MTERRKTKNTRKTNETIANELLSDNRFDEVIRFINRLDTTNLTAELYDIKIRAMSKCIDGKSVKVVEDIERTINEDVTAMHILQYGKQIVDNLKIAEEKSPEDAIEFIDRTPENLRCPPLYSLRASKQAKLVDMANEISDKVLQKCFKPCVPDVANEYMATYLKKKLDYLELEFNLRIGSTEIKHEGICLQYDANKNLICEREVDNRLIDLWPLVYETISTVENLLTIQTDVNQLLSVLSVLSMYTKYSVGLPEDRVKACIKEADKYMSLCSELYPETDIYWHRITFAMLVENYDYAISLCELALSREPDSEILLAKIECCIKKNDIIAALLENERYIELSKSNHGRLFLLGDYNPFSNKLKLLMELGRYSDYAEVMVLAINDRISDNLQVDNADFKIRKQSYEYCHLMSINIVKGLSLLLEQGQYNVILDHLSYGTFNIEILRWYNAWCLAYLDNQTDASRLFQQMDYGKICEELDKYIPNIWTGNVEHNDKSRLEVNIQYLYRGVSFHKISDWLFLSFLDPFVKVENGFSKAFHSYINVLSFGVIDKLEARADLVLYGCRIGDEKEEALKLFSKSISEAILSEVRTMNQIRLIGAREDERNRILSNLSHSIKNILRSIIDPLLNLKNEFPGKAVIIDNALKGANLIREMVNSINLSYETSVGDLLWDIKHPGSESMALQDMIISSLQYSIGNMFDFRYFPSYAENYYPRSLKKQDFEAVKEEWKTVSTTSSLSGLLSFADKNMFKLTVNLTDSAQYHIGNEKSSAIKLLILFQEIIFNSVKYASYVTRAERFIEIDLSEHDDILKLQISNSFRPEVQAKTTGVGKLVIENFAKVLDCTPVITTDNNVYTITMEFNNIWRDNA